MNENLKGYYLNKTGDRVKQLLDRQFIVPTLNNIPNEQTNSWLDGEYTVAFRVGELCRVKVNEKWEFYQLYDIIDGKCVWQKANTAEIPDLSNYATKTYVENSINNIPTPDVGDQIAAALIDYVKKVEGKGLSTNDFTNELKEKLEGITPFDPSELEAEIDKLETALNTLVSDNASNAIESFNEIVAFLKNVSDKETFSGIIAGVNAYIAEVEGKIPTKTSELKNDSGFLNEHQDISNLATKEELKNKVDKVNGKQLSTEDFTTALKNKLNGLVNYDDTLINNALNKLRSDFDTLVSGDTTTAIKTFNEVIAFLDGISDSEDLDSIIASIEQQIAIKYSKPNNGIPKSDLANNIQLSLDKADTALQEHQDIAHLATKDELNAKLDTIEDLTAIREGAALGVTALQEERYKGTYSKPNTGIPSTDLSTDVQSMLNKANSALLEETYKGTVSAVDTLDSLDEPLNGVIETLPNGNIKLTINGVTKNFMPATPSGDPMHYLFVGHGAKYNEGEDYILETEWAHLVDDVEYNATYKLNKITGTKVKTLEYQGVNYDIYEQNHYYLGSARKVWVVGVKSQNGTLVWDDTKVIHRKGYWLLNSIGDLTNQDMVDVVNQGVRYLTTPFCYAYHGSQYSEYKGRTNLPSYGGNNIIRNTNLNCAFYHNFSDVAIIGTSHNSETVFPILNQCISGSIRHMVGGLVKMVSENGEYKGNNMSTIRISNSAKSFKMSSGYISKKSILQAIETEAASSVITFNLKTSAFNRINNEPDIVEALSNHPNVTLAKI